MQEISFYVKTKLTKIEVQICVIFGISLAAMGAKKLPNLEIFKTKKIAGRHG